MLTRTITRRARGASALCLLFGILTIAGCGTESREAIVSSVGSFGEIAVVLSGDNLRAGVDEVLDTINPDVPFVLKTEKTYVFHHLAARRHKIAHNYRNILYVLRWGDGGPLQKEVDSLVSDETLDRFITGRGGVVYLENPYFQNQLLIIVVSPDRNSLMSVLRERREHICDLIDTHNIKRMARDSRIRGIHADVVQDYWRNFGFHLEIPGDYRENQVRPDDFPGVEWIRNDPTRGLSIAWIETEDPEAMMQDRDALAGFRRHLGDILHTEDIHESTFVWSEEKVAGVPAVKLAGAWSSRKIAAGGAFWCYFVPDKEHGRVYALDLLVYAPNAPKMNHFRRMRAILSTFSVKPPR